jgi:hypothetical protein
MINTNSQLRKSIKLQRDKEYSEYIVGNNNPSNGFILFINKRKEHWQNPQDDINQLTPRSKKKEEHEEIMVRKNAAKAMNAQVQSQFLDLLI